MEPIRRRASNETGAPESTPFYGGRLGMNRYLTLDVPRNADDETLRDAFRVLVLLNSD